MPTSLKISPNGKYFACMALDHQIRVFQFSTGKLIRKYDERTDIYDKAQMVCGVLQKTVYVCLM